MHSTNDELAYSRCYGHCFDPLTSNAKHISMDVLDIWNRNKHSRMAIINV